jgi:hypothetical protein
VQKDKGVGGISGHFENRKRFGFAAQFEFGHHNDIEFEFCVPYFVQRGLLSVPANRHHNPQMLFEGSVQDILLQVALGHSLPGSQSCLAVLSKDIIQHALASAIEEIYWKIRSQEGLLTPKPVAMAKFSTEIPAIIELPDQAIRRAVVRPIANVPRLIRTEPSTWIFPISINHCQDIIRCPVSNPAPTICSPRVRSRSYSLVRKSPKH